MSDLIVFTALVGLLAAAGIALGTRMASFVSRLAGPEDEASDATPEPDRAPEPGAEHQPVDPPSAEEEHRADA